MKKIQYVLWMIHFWYKRWSGEIIFSILLICVAVFCGFENFLEKIEILDFFFNFENFWNYGKFLENYELEFPK